MSNYLDNLELFDSKVIARGRTLYKDKKVQFTELSPTLAKATVFVDNHYNVHLQFDPERDLIAATCDCATGGFCEHMVAVIYEVSDNFSGNEEAFDDGTDKEIANAFAVAVEDVKNSVFRFNYKGLSKAMESFTSVLIKAKEEAKLSGIRLLFESFLFKGKYPVDYDRLTPYVRETLKRPGFTQDKIVGLFYDMLGENMASEALWIIMTKDPESSIPFQIAALQRIKEGIMPPHYLSAVCPITNWANVNPALLDELLELDSFEITVEQMSELITKASQKKDGDAVIELFAAAVKNFDGFLLDPSILTPLLDKEERRAKIESIFYDEFSFSPSPEKYLLWKSVATEEDFQNRFASSDFDFNDVTRDFILLCEGRAKVGDIYDSLDVRSIPFSLIPYALDKVEEDGIKQQLVDYCEEEESEIVRNLDGRLEDIKTLLKVYGLFSKDHLTKLLSSHFVIALSKDDPSLRGKLLQVAYSMDLLPILGVKVYQGRRE